MDSITANKLTEEPIVKPENSEFKSGKESNTSESSSTTLNSSSTFQTNVCPQNVPREKETPLSENEEKLVSDITSQNKEQSEESGVQNDQSTVDSTVDTIVESNNPSLMQYDIIQNEGNEKLSKAVIKISKPLCADYRSDSSSDSADSESDSSETTSDSSTSSDSEDESDNSQDSVSVKNKGKSEKKISRADLSICDLPPIENLKISVPEDACVEIGVITSIVDTLVVVESYKGSAALDVDTVLFLESGKKTLGRVFDILGPITEPVYAVRFNSEEEIKNLNIEKNMKVYFAPKTPHTNFVFMSEVLKHKGSDASWKDNIEAPPEFQDFSDDEEERLHKNKNLRESDGGNPNDQTKSRKRSFNKSKTSGPFQGNRFKNPNFGQQGTNFQRNPSFGPPRANFPNPVQAQPFPYNVPPFPPHLYFTPRFSGPPFPTFVNQGQNYQQPVYQQRTHAFPQSFGGWGRPMCRPPPPPPPPLSDQVVRQQNETQK